MLYAFAPFNSLSLINLSNSSEITTSPSCKFATPSESMEGIPNSLAHFSRDGCHVSSPLSEAVGQTNISCEKHFRVKRSTKYSKASHAMKLFPHMTTFLLLSESK